MNRDKIFAVLKWIRYGSKALEAIYMGFSTTLDHWPTLDDDAQKK